MGDLCTACMCSGRNLYCIGETGFYHLYIQILNEMQVYDTSVYIRVCWECLAALRKWQRFKQRVKDSYTQLQYIQQNNFIQQPPNPPHLQIYQVYNFSYPEASFVYPFVIKTELDEAQATAESDKLESIKTEEMHYEPETFVNNLNVEPKKKKKDAKKLEKPIKEKPKKKIKPKAEKVLKKKVKVKIKHSPSLDSVHDEHLDDDLTHYDDDLEKDGDMDQEKIAKVSKKEVSFNDEPLRLNGEVSIKAEVRAKEVLPERPQCAECGKNFSSRKTYRYHLNVLHKGQNRYPCPRCGKVYQWKSNLGRHLRSHKARDSGELYCETCDKRFASVATYRQHLRVSRQHVPESEFSFMCNECGKKFVNKTRLRDHIDWEHLKKIKFRCQLCNKPFKCHTSLYVHMQNVHRDKEKKDNLCHVCGKSYQNAAKLKYHIVAMHTSETPYQCQQCSAAFGWYSSLYRHVREVHFKMKVQPKKSKKSKKTDILPSLLTQPIVLGQIHQPGPP